MRETIPKSSDSLETVHVQEIEYVPGFALVWIKQVPVTRVGIADLMCNLADRKLNVKQAIQTTTKEGRLNLLFTVLTPELKAVSDCVESFCCKQNACPWGYIPDVTRIILHGPGIKTHSQVVSSVLEKLDQQKIELLMIGSSEMSLSLFVGNQQEEETRQCLEKLFG